jgi:hypothetical protein
MLDAGDDAEQRCLAAAGRAEEAQHLARRNVEGNGIESEGAAVAARHSLERDFRGEADGSLAAPARDAPAERFEAPEHKADLRPCPGRCKNGDGAPQPPK